MSLPTPPDGLLDDAGLFLDFDGTLVELAPTPDAIVVPPALPGLLRRLADALPGRVAIVTGRRADDILGFLGLDPAAPGLAVAGSHGAETLWPDGRRETQAVPAALDRAVATLDAFAATRPGVIVERKPVGLTVHYRQAPEHGEACVAETGRLADETGLELLAGKAVVELRPAGTDKGHAVERLLVPGTRPVFVGDDVTDEAGFRAAAAAGGAGVLVGARDGSAAGYALPDVAAVLAWLSAA